MAGVAEVAGVAELDAVALLPVEPPPLLELLLELPVLCIKLAQVSRVVFVECTTRDLSPK